MARWLGWALLGALAGCATAMPPSPSPTVAASASPAASDVSPAPTPWVGWWGLSDVAPSPSVVPATPGLEFIPARSLTLFLTQEGDAIKLVRYEYCGKASEEASGVPRGDRLRLEGTAYRGQVEVSPLVYDLTFDASTMQVRGTRNGRPVWLVHQEPYITRGPFCNVTVSGRLFDETGAVVRSKATVRIVSLSASNPFETTIDVVDGAYRMDYLPTGVPLVMTAEAAGRAPRSRDVLIERGPEAVVNFGGAADPEDPEGWRYPLEPSVSPSPR